MTVEHGPASLPVTDKLSRAAQDGLAVSPRAQGLPAATVAPTASERLVALDALRGVMALCVAVYHFAVWTHVFKAGSRLSSNVIVLGVHSVEGFFIISGVCFFYLYARAQLGFRELYRFHIKRYFRIAPLFYLAMAGSVLLGIAVGPRTPARLLENLSLSFGLFHPNHAMVLGGWSIGVEYVFYLLLPLFLLWTRRFGALSLLVVLLLCALPYNYRIVPGTPELSRFNAYVQLPNHGFLFAIGGVLVALRERVSMRLSPRWVGLGALALALLFQLWLTPFYDHFYVMVGSPRAVCLLFCTMLVVLATLCRAELGPRLRPLVVLGDLSYAIYLLHPFAWQATRALLEPAGMPRAAFALGLTLTVVLAAIVHYGFERPALRLGRKLASARRLGAQVAAFSVLTVLLADPSAALADPFHFQGIPLGQRALGFGGAFTGLADDPSASYYNPAGLVTAGDSALSASFTLNAFDRRTIVKGYRTALGSRTLKHSSDPSLPTSVSVLKRIGKRMGDGERNHAIGLSTFTVDQRSLSFDVEIHDQPRTGIATLSVDRTTRTTWHGFSYAYRIDEHWSVGATGFLSLTRTNYRDELIATDLGPLVEGEDRFESNAGSWASHRTKTDVKSLVARIGVVYRQGNRLRIGVMFQPPSIHVRGKASVRERSLDIDRLAGQGSFLTVRQSGLASYNPHPWELRVGMSYRTRPWLLLSADASLYGPNGSPKRPVVHIGPRSPDKQTGAFAGVGYFESDHWYRPASGNLAFGTEVRLVESLALRAGLFTSLSASPNVPKRTARYVDADIHRIGGALSMAVDAGGFDLSLGVTGLFGRGQGLALDTRDAAEPYHRTVVRDATLFVFLTGIRNVVATLAKKADQKLQEIRKERERLRKEQERKAAEEQVAPPAAPAPLEPDLSEPG